MNNFVKKLVSACLSTAIAVSMTTAVFAAETFTDMPNDWRTTAIENAVKNGLISGMGDGTVAPDANITRAQMAAIIVRALGATQEADISGFVDVSSNKWYYKELSKAVYMQAFSGDDQKRMNPENNITFQECFVVLSRVFGLDIRTTAESAKAALSLFQDGSGVAGWAVPYYGSIVANGYWAGGEEGLLTPKDYITRGEFAVVMDNLVKTYVSEPGDLKELPTTGNIVVRCDDAVLDGLQLKGDVIIGDGVSAGKISMKDVNIDGRLVLRGCATPGYVEKTDSEGNVKKEYTCIGIGCSPSGSIFDVQIIAPYIGVNLANVNFKKAHGVKNSKVHLGEISA